MADISLRLLADATPCAWPIRDVKPEHLDAIERLAANYVSHETNEQPWYLVRLDEKGRRIKP